MKLGDVIVFIVVCVRMLLELLLLLFLLAVAVFGQAPSPPPFPTNVVSRVQIRHVPPTFELSWDASVSPGIVGYNIYQGTISQDYTNEISVGDVTNVTLTNGNPWLKYYFAAAAVNAQGIQSALSGETSFQQRTNLPPTPVRPTPALECLESTDLVNWDWCVVQWLTNGQSQRFFKGPLRATIVNVPAP